jgi:Gpi18-like mannosyltransferase
MKTKKSTAFWAVYLFLAAAFAVVAWRAPEHLVEALGAILTALVAAAASYQASNSADNYTRSKHYRPELDPATSEAKQ